MSTIGGYFQVSTTGGAALTVATSLGKKFGGYTANGSAGGMVFNVKDGAAFIVTTTAGAGQTISLVLNTPIIFNTAIQVTVDAGTGYYSVLVTT